jgi:hypothetical protein
VKLVRVGPGLGKYVFSPAAVVALLVLLSTAVVLAAPPTKTHPPKDQPSASVQVDEDESPEAEESDEADASNSPGACNALHGNAYQVISDLVANWPTKHDKGDKTKDVPSGLQKVLDRLLECQGGADPGANAGPEDPDPSPSASVAPDESTKVKSDKKADHGKKDH